MKRKVVLSQALGRLYPSMPVDFEARTLRMLKELAENKEERIVKKKISLGLVLAAALIMLLMGVALALTQFGIWDFVKDYGETPLPEAATMVQTEFGEKTFPLSDNATVTLKEAISDGLMGSIVVEYRTPEGTYLYAPDSMQKTDPVIYGEQVTQEEVFQKYGPFYHARDEKIGVLVDGVVQPLDSDYGWTPVKMADNVLLVHLSFCLQGIDPNNLVYNPGIFKMESLDWEQRQRLAVDVPLKLELNADKCVTVTPKLPDTAVALGIKAVTVASTPLTLAVKVQLETLEANGLFYGFQAQDEAGKELETSFLSSFAGYADKEAKSITRGYAPVESLPDAIYIQIKANGSTGEEQKIGEPVKIQLR